MFTLELPAIEIFDEISQSFRDVSKETIELEHSLFSMSKWESSFEKPFLSDDEKSMGETVAYVNCMAVSPVDEDVLERLTADHFRKINEYVASKQSATWFASDKKAGRKPPRKEIITAEIVYHWMVAMQIPWEAQYWHLNRLLTLIRVIDEKSQKPKKMSRKDSMAQHKALNASRRNQMGSNG